MNKYMVTFTGHSAGHKASVEKFKQGDGVPGSVKVLGRWHVAGTGRGFMLIETADLSAVHAWAFSWSQLQEFTVSAVLEDAQVLASLK